LHVADLEGVIQRLHAAGAQCTSPLANRDWGDRAAYFMTPDGYVIAVAARMEREA
jgi:lactoylglutathione lyase